MSNEYMMHYDCISRFNNITYSNIFTEENIVSPKVAIKVGDQKFYGYFLEKGQVKYFMLDSFLESLPFRATDTQEIDFRNYVYTVIKSIAPVRIPTEKKMSFREMIDALASFKHSNPINYKLMNILTVASWVDRINARVSTGAGFGKDSGVDIVSGLVDSTSNIYGATFAKLEYSLTNKLIVLNELGNLKKEELIEMQRFLLATGSYTNTYIKRSRKTATTQEQYDISKLSILIFYNLPSYYLAKAQEYFDQMFTRAVIERFIAFLFEGTILTNFDRLLDVNAIVENNTDIYRNIIATINYYRENKVDGIIWDVPTIVHFPDHLKNRYGRTFHTIMKYVSEYCDTQEEFDEYVTELYNAYLRYENAKVAGVAHEVKIK